MNLAIHEILQGKHGRGFFHILNHDIDSKSKQKKKELYNEILDSECKSMDVKSDAQIERFSRKVKEKKVSTSM